MPVRPLREQWLMYQQQRWPQDRYDLLVQSSDITVSCNAKDTVSCVLQGVQPDVWPVITGVGVDSVMRLDHSDRVMGLVGCALPFSLQLQFILVYAWQWSLPTRKPQRHTAMQVV